MNYNVKHHTFAICAYKESPYLEECILSLIKQTVKSHIIVTTSTPCKQTETLAEKYDLPIIINHAKPGIGSDWNFAYNNANTPLVTIAHQDDLYEPQYTAQMLKCINQVENPIIYFSGYGELRNNEKIYSSFLLNIKKIMLQPLKKEKKQAKKNIRRRILSFGNPICCPSVTYIKPNCGDKNIFNTSFKCDLDWEQWEQLSKREGSFVYNPTPLMLHRIHSESETSTLIESQIRTNEDLEIFKRFWSQKTAIKLTKLYALSQKSNNL